MLKREFPRSIAELSACRMGHVIRSLEFFERVRGMFVAHAYVVCDSGGRSLDS
ncbi:MAG TPA: hypothetical protein VFR78_05345 [Pyrinomonadaceae bacterium]|nr:hypothetical protein [Pyrinomonadaceae bacterium]